jgi:hypothetical protein
MKVNFIWSFFNNITALWNETLCSVVDFYKCFGETFTSILRGKLEVAISFEKLVNFRLNGVKFKNIIMLN